MLAGLIDAPLAQLGAACVAALAVFMAGVKKGNAEFITATHVAAKHVIDAVLADNKRLTERLEKAEANEARCQENLAATRRELGLRPMPA